MSLRNCSCPHLPTEMKSRGGGIRTPANSTNIRHNKCSSSLAPLAAGHIRTNYREYLEGCLASKAASYFMSLDTTKNSRLALPSSTAISNSIPPPWSRYSFAFFIVCFSWQRLLIAVLDVCMRATLGKKRRMGSIQTLLSESRRWRVFSRVALPQCVRECCGFVEEADGSTNLCNVLCNCLAGSALVGIDLSLHSGLATSSPATQGKEV
jgi:hypothetical protein